MRRYRVALFMLCIALLGALPFIISLPKPDGAQQEAAVQRKNSVQRQIAAQRQASAAQGTAQDRPVRTEIGAPLQRALALAKAGKYTQAFAAVDGLKDIPNKTVKEARVIDQMHTYLLFKASGLTDREVR